MKSQKAIRNAAALRFSLGHARPIAMSPPQGAVSEYDVSLPSMPRVALEWMITADSSKSEPLVQADTVRGALSSMLTVFLSPRTSHSETCNLENTYAKADQNNRVKRV